jgi:2-keto-4-pentenoate hydratase
MAFLGIAEPIRGRLFAERLFTDGAAMDLGNGAEAEPEIMLTLGRPLAPGADPLAAVSRACFAAELVRPTRSDAFAQGPGFIVADNAAGLAALIGAGGAAGGAGRTRCAARGAERGRRHDGRRGRRCAGGPASRPRLLASALGELPAGTVVLTGAMARAIPAPPGAALLLDCGAWGRAWARVF